MFFASVRFLIGIMIILLGAVIHWKVGVGTAWYMYLAGVIILITHFLFGNVLLAYSKLNKGKVDEAENLLLQIKRPKWLLKGHRAYYYFVLGIISLQKKQTGFGEQYLKNALEIGLRRPTENALAALNIAEVNFAKKNFKKAEEYRKIASSFASNDLLVKEHLKKLEQALKGRLK